MRVTRAGQRHPGLRQVRATEQRHFQARLGAAARSRVGECRCPDRKRDVHRVVDASGALGGWCERDALVGGHLAQVGLDTASVQHVGGTVDIERIGLPDRIRRLDDQRGVQAMLLVRTRPHVVVREHGAQGVVLVGLRATAHDDRVGPPALRGALRAAVRVFLGHHQQIGVVVHADRALGALALLQQRAVTAALVGRGDAAVGAEQRVHCGLERVARRSAVVREDAFAHFVGREGRVLVVPAVARTVARCHVELHQVDVLADRVGGRVDLEVVAVERAGQEVGRFEVDAIARVGAEEQRLGHLGAPVRVDHVLDVLLQDHDAALRVEPAVLVDGDLGLDERALVVSRRRVLRARVGVGRTGGASAAVHMKERLVVGCMRRHAGHRGRERGEVAARVRPPVGPRLLGQRHRFELALGERAGICEAPFVELHCLLLVRLAAVRKRPDFELVPVGREGLERQRVVAVDLFCEQLRCVAAFAQRRLENFGVLGCAGLQLAERLERATGDHVPRQAAVDDVGGRGFGAVRGGVDVVGGSHIHVERGLRRPVAWLAGDVERIAAKCRARHRRQRDARQRHDGR